MYITGGRLLKKKELIVIANVYESTTDSLVAEAFQPVY